MPSRRWVLKGSLATVAAGAGACFLSPRPAAALVLGAPSQFDFETVVSRARSLASEPHKPAVVDAPQVMDEIDYDAHWRIRFRDEATFGPEGSDALIQLFHPGKFFPEPVAMHLVEDGEAREILFDQSMFSMPEDSPARALTSAGYAGFRVMRPGIEPDWVSFLGASYFRTDGPFNQYGLSARALAVDTGLAVAEEFPRFSAFWLAAPREEGAELTAYALLESPSVTGAYRFDLSRGGEGEGHRTTVASRLFFRERVERLGIAPLTSMYWYSERSRVLADDWRPEVHDSDGLAMATGTGERIWRPLNNPRVVRTSSFADQSPGGFGLVQRDRAFHNYEDDGVFYDRRPSAWVEPRGDWGAGSVQLIEIPADDETFDNIVAYWAPETIPDGGDAREYDYVIHWIDRDPRTPVATVRAVRQGMGGVVGRDKNVSADKLVIDFEGEAVAGLGREDGVEPVVSVSGGRLIGEPTAYPIVGTDHWRLMIEFESEGDGIADIRAFLRREGLPLTETVLAQARNNRTDRPVE